MDNQNFNVSLLDPSSWEEPRETIPVRVKVSRFRWSAPEYNRATSFRQAFPYRGEGYGPEGNSIQQWDLQLERYDAVFVRPDGTEVPATLYAGVDLEKLDSSGVLKPIMRTRGKEQFIITAWTRVVGSLVPDPSRIEGMNLLVERYREKEIAPGFYAKNVIVPIEVLPPDYRYTGPVQKFRVRATEPATESVSNATESKAGEVSVEQAASLIRQFLASRGISAEKAPVSILADPEFPAAARIEPFLTAIATGGLAEVLDGFKS
jgi:hypothetical protein